MAKAAAKKKPADAQAALWKTRIVGTGEEDPEQLLANPANWRIHPTAQRSALAGVLDRVGWIQNIVINKATGHVVDGHLRADLAVQLGETRVPVLYVELTEEEEMLALAALDPIAGMAVPDPEKLVELATALDLSDNEALSLRIDGMTGLNLGMGGAPDFGDGPDPLPPTGIAGGAGGPDIRNRVVIVFEDDADELDFWQHLGIDAVEGRVRYFWTEMRERMLAGDDEDPS
jgi:hypothetical protein